MGFEVVIGGKNLSPDQLLLEDLDKVQQILGGGVADVIDGVGRQGQAVLAGGLVGGTLHDPHDAFHNIIHIGEVPQAVAVVEDLDGLALDQLVGEAEVGHVGPTGRAIDSEEPQAGGRDIVELGIGMGKQLIALFGGGVEGHGVIHLVLGGVGDLLVGAVDGGRRCVDQMLHTRFAAVVRVAAGLQNVIEANDVGLDVGIRVGDGITNASLGRQIHHHLGLITGKHVVDEGAVRNVAQNELKAGFGMQGDFLLDLLQTPVLDGHVVVVGTVIHGHDGDGGDFPQQLQDQVGTDEADTAGDEDGFIS